MQVFKVKWIHISGMPISQGSTNLQLVTYYQFLWKVAIAIKVKLIYSLHNFVNLVINQHSLCR